MEFTVTKKGYSPREVEEYISAVKREYESTIIKQRDRIKQMLEEKSELVAELEQFKSKSDQISKSILSAVDKAEEIEHLSRIKYNQEIARLKAFHEKWTEYYRKIMEAYPLDATLAAAGEFNRKMDKILSRVQSDELAATEPAERDITPMDRIDRYFASEQGQKAGKTESEFWQERSPARNKKQSDYADRSPSGFSFEEALNPTQDLEDILKDLGI